ncbi:MAG: hypothetical protein A2Y38_21590 [Spirochaetes bacterium GWB1_59_5]|nr:MAG: hypothetical protein A2Y38_21590 [Spirochaetes bacterium GWB1_59_5]
MAQLDRVQLIKLMLLRDDRYSVLPLLYEMFGEEAFFRFLSVFAGVTFRVPSAARLERAVRDVRSYMAAQSGDMVLARRIAQESSLDGDRTLVSDPVGLAQRLQQMQQLVDGLSALDRLDVVTYCGGQNAEKR